ncbi:two component transcriptional regulator, AraC [Paenibacillus sp. JCM 10914]|nr:two component transcriptional regulator, AraC [Paenibacillus sp. JCM 10914]
MSGALMESLIMGGADEVLLQEWERRLEVQPDDRLYYVFVELNDASDILSMEEPVPVFKDQVEAALLQLTHGEQPFYLHEHRKRVGIIVPERILLDYPGRQREFAALLQQLLGHRSEGRVFIYFGEAVTRLADIQQAYESAKESLLFKYVFDDVGLIFYEEVSGQDLHLQYVGLEDKLYKQLVEQIEELDFGQLEASIHTLFHTFRVKLYAPEAVKLAINQFVLGVLRVLQDMDGDQDKLASLTPITEWQDHNVSLRALQGIFTDFAVESAYYIAELRKEQHKGGIQKIKAYIESNYHDNISLKSIAAKFYMNPVYLGQLFKKAYGVYFNDFLLQLRVGEAKRLLRQTDLRIYEVAERVGFGNPDYFVTQFEKTEQMTPSEYRGRLMKEAASKGTDR